MTLKCKGKGWYSISYILYKRGFLNPQYINEEGLPRIIEASLFARGMVDHIKVDKTIRSIVQGFTAWYSDKTNKVNNELEKVFCTWLPDDGDAGYESLPIDKDGQNHVSIKADYTVNSFEAIDNGVVSVNKVGIITAIEDGESIILAAGDDGKKHYYKVAVKQGRIFRVGVPAETPGDGGGTEQETAGGNGTSVPESMDTGNGPKKSGVQASYSGVDAGIEEVPALAVLFDESDYVALNVGTNADCYVTCYGKFLERKDNREKFVARTGRENIIRIAKIVNKLGFISVEDESVMTGEEIDASVPSYSGSISVDLESLLNDKKDRIKRALNGHEDYVDFGMDVVWAKCNVGASEPWEYGDYFAWGETKPKKSYSEFNYKKRLVIKYSRSSEDYRREINLVAADDAARANWGGEWRMPTKKEWVDLFSKAYSVWTENYMDSKKAGLIVYKAHAGDEGIAELSDSGVYTLNYEKGEFIAGGEARKSYSVKSDEHIFLPAADLIFGDDPDICGSLGYYWSSSLPADYSSGAFSCCFNSGGVNPSSWDGRFYGLSVRPVLSSSSFQ